MKYQPIQPNLTQIEEFLSQPPHQVSHKSDQLSAYLNSSLLVLEEAWRLQKDIILHIIGHKSVSLFSLCLSLSLSLFLSLSLSLSLFLSLSHY